MELMTFSQEQVALIKSMVAKDATDNELKLFLNQCQRTGLDPLTRQIYFVKRAGRVTIQTSIDGFRVVAERSGLYAGQDEPVFTYDEHGELLKCAVTVYKFSPSGERYPAAVGVAFYREYYPNPINLQKTLKHTMLAKVAESLALRKAFPQDLSGLYTTDEMAQANQKDDFDDIPTDIDKKPLISLVYSSTLDEDKKEMALEKIALCTSWAEFDKIEARLEDCQPSIDEVVNPNQTDIKNHIKKLA